MLYLYDVLVEASKANNFKEWKKLLLSNDLTKNVIVKLDKIPQGTKYHPEFSALVHTYYVCKAIKDMGLNHLLESGFLHDIGKYEFTNIGRNRIYHFGHPEQSEKYVDEVKEYIAYYDITKYVVRNHMSNITWNNVDYDNINEIYNFIFQYCDKVYSKLLYTIESNFIQRLYNKLRFKYTLLKTRLSCKKIYVLVGISGSGKSKYIKDNKLDKYTVSTDEIRRNLNGNLKIYNQSQNEMVWETAKQYLRDRIGKFGIAYLDATNVSKYLRIKFMSHFRDCQKIAIVFRVDGGYLEKYSERIQKDLEGGKDRADVSINIIKRQHSQFNKGLSSLTNEFHKIIYVEESKDEHKW